MRAAIDRAALDQIADVLSGTTWDTDTAAEVAEVLRMVGRTVLDLDEQPAPPARTAWLVTATHGERRTFQVQATDEADALSAYLAGEGQWIDTSAEPPLYVVEPVAFDDDEVQP